ncbi:MAG: 4-alpha-glucanotransferase [Zetaproteobacteria bacterium]|nr:4-alpha-glucanotransferase [Zetaproteobacteria bacterium]
MSSPINPLFHQRRSGLLLHITSLPSPQKTGSLGIEALQFIDGLVLGGFTVWQFLPLGPTHAHGSPYESLSSMAGNPDLIDLRECLNEGWLSEVDYQRVLRQECTMSDARAIAAAAFWQQCKTDEALLASVDAFSLAQDSWLYDYALFSALKRTYHQQPWWQWPLNIRDRHPTALSQATTDSYTFIQQTLFEQYLFDRQWCRIKAYAEAKGVLLFGDIPIYVAHDSVDAWVNRQYFTINKQGLCDEVAGVPPDYFSETGQRWGNPLYRWDMLEADHFQWWIERIKVQYQRMHMMRIDHFRGLEAYWAIPGHSEDGRIGEWRKAPGDRCLSAIEKALGSLPLIAEDLGIITAEVDALRNQFALPGMKILQFAFGGNADNPYLPHQHRQDSVCYTGTHDNDTSLGWYTSAPKHEREHMLRYLNAPIDDPMPWPLVKACLASVSQLAILPMQDVLALGSEARFNTPGTLEKNWSWRMSQMPKESQWQRMQQFNTLYGRTAHS